MLSVDFSDATLLLIGHGSTVNDDSGATVYQHASELRRRRLFAEVREAFFKSEPRIGPVLASLRTSKVFVVPFFTAEGYFTRQAIPSELGLPAGARNTIPFKVEIGTRTLVYCLPVGMHPSMTDIILARAKGVLVDSSGTQHVARPSETQTRSHITVTVPDTALVIAGHGTTLNPDSRRSIERQVECIAARGIFAEVHPAFLEEEPRIAHIPMSVEASCVVVVPFFMSEGLHVCEDIPVLLGENRSTVRERLKAGQWPWRNPTEIGGKSVFYARGVGSEPGLAEVILEQVRFAVMGCGG